MQAELIEIREFLAEHPPFDQLPGEILDALPKRLTVRYLRRGSPFPPEQGADTSASLLRAGAVEFRSAKGELLEKIGEGEFFVATCPDSDDTLLRNGTCSEDTLLYLIPCDELLKLRQQFPEFNSHFEKSMRLRLQNAIDQLQHGHGTLNSLMNLKAGTLVHRPPEVITPEQTIRQAAQKMGEEQVSALLIMENNSLLGIVTDRDLSLRCIAAGVDVNQPVSTIMTSNVFALDEDRAAFDALLEMTRRKIQHLPIVSRGGVMRGVISASEILYRHSLNTISLAATIKRTHSVDDLVEATGQLPELQMQMLSSGMTAEQLTQALSAVTDAITERLLQLAETELGAPPVPYVWLACGSQARREQTTVSDQDNAMLIDNAMQPEHDEYFAALARFVSDGLNRCGFRYCPGDAMATNPKWRQTLSGWQRHFDNWVNTPQKMSLMLTSIFFDIRPIYGDESLYQKLRDKILPQCKANRIFLAYMAANALKNRPPLGFFRKFVLVHDGEHDDSLDLKHRGILPIVDLARVFALSAGLPQLGTKERLIAAREAGQLSQEGAENLLHALEFIATLRARAQVAEHTAGQPMDSYVRPDSLSGVERNQLKDAFSAISTVQQALAQRYQTERFT